MAVVVVAVMVVEVGAIFFSGVSVYCSIVLGGWGLRVGCLGMDARGWIPGVGFQGYR